MDFMEKSGEIGWDNDPNTIFGQGGEWTLLDNSGNEAMHPPARPREGEGMEEAEAEVLESKITRVKIPSDVPSEEEILAVVLHGHPEPSGEVPSIPIVPEKLQQQLSDEMIEVMYQNRKIGMTLLLLTFGSLALCGTVYLIAWAFEAAMAEVSRLGAAIMDNAPQLKTAGIGLGMLLFFCLFFCLFIWALIREVKKQRHLKNHSTSVDLFKQVEPRPKSTADINQTIIINNNF